MHTKIESIKLLILRKFNIGIEDRLSEDVKNLGKKFSKNNNQEKF